MPAGAVTPDHDVRSGSRAVIRAAGLEDEPFLWAMLAEAAHEPEVQIVKDHPDLARYVRDWGREGDLGVIAEDPQNDEPLGACWLRLWTGTDRGYGYIDDQTPELSTAVRPQWRGMGIGTRLLVALLRRARAAHSAIALSVRTDNPALRLYERLGFRAVEGSEVENRVGGVSVTMKADFAANGPNRSQP